MHYGGGWPFNGWPKAHYEKQNSGGFHTDFHKYQVNWTPDFIEFSIDDEVVRAGTVHCWGFKNLKI